MCHKIRTIASTRLDRPIWLFDKAHAVNHRGGPCAMLRLRRRLRLGAVARRGDAVDILRQTQAAVRVGLRPSVGHGVMDPDSLGDFVDVAAAGTVQGYAVAVSNFKLCCLRSITR